MNNRTKTAPTLGQLYAEALAADDAFEAAVKAQFGPRASRWNTPHALYSAATRGAQEAKHRADTAAVRRLRLLRGARNGGA